MAATKGREGARWINERPTSEEFGDWFGKNVPLDDKLKPENYVGGCVLIPAVEKARVVRGFNEHTGAAMIDERDQLVYIPYAKVETRIAYFWDLLEVHQEWTGDIEYVETQRPSVEPITTHEHVTHGEQTIERDTSRVPAAAQIVEQLPPGFFLMPVPVGQGFAHFLCCTISVVIRAKDDGHVLRRGRGTKMVALTKSSRDGNRSWCDENSIMKAETGALGRALGVAGIFVIPGSGVATAEDMLEMREPGDAAAQEEARTPEQVAPPEPVRAEAGVTTAPEQAQDERAAIVESMRVMLADASENYPGVLEQFREWGQQRRPPITNMNELQGAALRGAAKRLEKILDEAKAAATEREATSPEDPSAGPEDVPLPEEPDVEPSGS